MASTLFLYDDQKGVFLHPDAISLEPLLGKLPAEDLLFIILITDYYSPYRQLTHKQRRLTASTRCFKNNEYDKHEKRLKKEIELYDSLQYDIRRETQKNYRAKISLLNINMMAANSPLEIKNIQTAIELLSKEIDKIEHDIYTDELATNSIEGRDKMSLLEIWQANRRRSKTDKTRLAEIQDLRSPTKARKQKKKKESKKEEL
jgi:hypothetical protein